MPFPRLARTLVLLSLALATPAVAAPDQKPAPAVPAAVPAERLSFAVVIGNNKSLGRRRPELEADDGIQQGPQAGMGARHRAT